MMNSDNWQSLGSKIAYNNIVTINQDIKTLEKLGLLKKNINERPYLIAHYDANDAGNRSYIKGQQELTKTLGIPYSALNSNLLANGEDVLQTIKNQNAINLIGAIFIANPIHPDVDFQQAVDSIDPIKEIDGLSTFHKSKYMGEIIENLEGVYFHPTAVSVISLLQEILGQDLSNKNILVAGGSGKVGSMVCALLRLIGANPEIYNISPDKPYKPEEFEGLLDKTDGFISAIRGAQIFDGTLFHNFHGPIIDLTTAKNNQDKTVGGVQTLSLDPNGDYIYIPPTKGGVGTITKTQLIANYIRAIIQKMKQNGKDWRYFDDIILKTDNSDIIQPTQMAN